MEGEEGGWRRGVLYGEELVGMKGRTMKGNDGREKGAMGGHRRGQGAGDVRGAAVRRGGNPWGRSQRQNLAAPGAGSPNRRLVHGAYRRPPPYSPVKAGVGEAAAVRPSPPPPIPGEGVRITEFISVRFMGGRWVKRSS